MGVKIKQIVEDRLFLETDNGCGFCGVRDAGALTLHHIYHEGEIDNSYDNLIVLCHNCHLKYHQKKGITQEQIIEVKRRLILKTLTPFGIGALKIAYRKGFVAGIPFTLNHLLELGLLDRLQALSWVCLEEDDGQETEIESRVVYKITNKGRSFFGKWKL